MLIITCKHCGPRPDIEFSFLRALEASHAHIDAAVLHTRTNPVGPSEEIWQHSRGCRALMVLRRHTLTHEILEVRPCPRDTA